MKASELKEIQEFITTPFPPLNTVLGGGIALGKISEIAGSWSTGNSTIAYQIIGTAQKQGRECLLIDAERAYTNSYFSSLGGDPEKLDLFRAKTLEEYFDHVIEWCEVKKYRGGLVVIDAMGALLSKEEAEKTSESSTIGIQARKIGAFSRRITPLLDDNGIALLALNHTFVPLGMNSTSSSGGRKWEYVRSVWMVISAAYGQPVKKAADGLKTLIPMSLEVRKNKIIPTMGTKIPLQLVQGAGFVGEDVPLPEKKKGGRKSVSPLSNSGDVTSVVKRVDVSS